MATYRVTGPDGTSYRVEGPDGASQEEVLNQIQAYRQSQSQPAPAAPAESAAPSGAIAPGDVAARMKQLGVSGNVQQGFTNTPDADTSGRGRPLLGGTSVLNPIIGPLNEFFSGVGEAAGGLGEMVSNPMQGPAVPATDVSSAVSNTMESSLGKTALGVGRAMAAPLAPLSDVASAIGGGTANLLDKMGMHGAANTVGALAQTTADVLSPFAAAKYAKDLKLVQKEPSIAEALSSKRMKVTAAEEQLVQAEKAANEKLAAIQRETAQGKRFVGQVAEEQKMAIPTAEELKAKFAPDAKLSMDVGSAVKQGFQSAWKKSSDRFNQLYGKLTQLGEGIDVVPENYVKAGGQLQPARTVTGLPSTVPERIGAKASKINISAMEDDTYTALKKQLAEAPPGDQARMQGVIDEFKKNSMFPESVPPTMSDLILERQRLKAGQRAVRGDWAKKQFDGLIGGLEADIAKANPEAARALFATDKLYATEHAPYFSQGALMRSIAEGDSASIVDAIYRPTKGAGGRVAPSSKAVKAIEDARQIITDPKQWNEINKAFVNKGIESAMEGGVLNQKKLVQWWNKYLDTANTGNAALRKGLGEETFRDLNSTMNQLQRTTPETIDSYAKQLVKGLEQDGKTSAATVQAAHKAVKDQLLEKIAVNAGVSKATAATRLESIGSGLFVSGLMRSSSVTMLRGAGLVMSAQALGTVLSAAKGRSLMKAMLRSVPGTTQRAAAARQLQNFIESIKEQE